MSDQQQPDRGPRVVSGRPVPLDPRTPEEWRSVLDARAERDQAHEALAAQGLRLTSTTSREDFERGTVRRLDFYSPSGPQSASTTEGRDR